MRAITICFLSGMLLSSCHDDAREKITDVFRPALTNTRPVTTKSYSFGHGFCGQDIYINSDYTFTWKHGCEGQSSSCVGKWQIAGDSILLTPSAQKSNNIPFRVSFSKSNNDSQVVIVVTDKSNTPIGNFVILPFNSKPAFTFTDEGVMMGNKDYKQSYFQDNLSTDSTGTIKLLKAEKDSLDFSKLYVLTGRKFRISTNNLPDTIRLTVGINAAAFAEYQIKYLAEKPAKFSYVAGKLIFNK
ncbi:hypothetical protein [Mucilaginibacter sp. FT3.2]|uniref:hypothetical protein n=1 Tax=Mucilaginibacter sp. FT3.2 TaxID=2723090 RepID=UPI00161EAB3C|nr:hypothetical protein [Mucilaginibacter sp. FT3.2]MBB6233119.1 hypothetical protein [Mucilaginibacter sp. FT3.2]